MIGDAVRRSLRSLSWGLEAASVPSIGGAIRAGASSLATRSNRRGGKSPSFQYVHIFPKTEVECEAARAGFSLAATDVSDAYVLTRS